MSVEEIRSRVGELPSLRRSPTRKHWPWNRSKTNRGKASNVNNSPPQSPLFGPSENSKKSDFCIGSIFGLDVGGTLAKLVYFEQRTENAEANFVPFRERIYRSSASAHAVLLARRGVKERSHSIQTVHVHSSPPSSLKRTTLHHSASSDEDLSHLYTMRQESVPDDLNAYGNSHPHGIQDRFHTTESMEAGKLSAELRCNSKQVETKSDLRKSRSMCDFSKRRDEALDRFYNFARRLDSYREGVKDHELSFYSRRLGGDFHFIRFETRRMQNAMDLIRANQLHLNIREMGATGGGAHKYANQWMEELGVEMKKQDELDSLVAGMQFVLSTVVGECYTFRPIQDLQTPTSSNETNESTAASESDFEIDGVNIEENGRDDHLPENCDVAGDTGKGDEWWYSRKVQRDSILDSSTYPYLLVSIGTGVSILRVDGPRNHQRISGSTIGGGTYWGLIRLLTDIEDFETVIRLAESGDPSKVDVSRVEGASYVID
jgi:pantothenate kinase